MLDWLDWLNWLDWNYESVSKKVSLITDSRDASASKKQQHQISHGQKNIKTKYLMENKLHIVLYTLKVTG